MTVDPTIVANIIASGELNADGIRTMQQLPAGAEILRLIVRDDLGGAAETITNALWDTL